MSRSAHRFTADSVSRLSVQHPAWYIQPGIFLGHFAVALGAKKAAPRASLGTLIGAQRTCSGRFSCCSDGSRCESFLESPHYSARLHFISVLAQPIRSGSLGARGSSGSVSLGVMEMHTTWRSWIITREIKRQWTWPIQKREGCRPFILARSCRICSTKPV